MRRHLIFLMLLCLAVLPTLTSCSNDDNGDGSNEYANWRARNDAYFADIRAHAKDTILLAQNQYGNTWTQHCNWRTFLSYAKDSTVSGKSTDSIYVYILRQGTGSGCPLSTDSCRIFYRGRLIPSETYTEGYVFSHSGQSTRYEEIFNLKTAVPSMLRASTAVKGFGTALQHMHIGDIWRVYVPYDLGYGSTAQTSIPSYSTLVFEIQLLSYYHQGATIDTWN